MQGLAKLPLGWWEDCASAAKGIDLQQKMQVDWRMEVVSSSASEKKLVARQG